MNIIGRKILYLGHEWLVSGYGIAGKDLFLIWLLMPKKDEEESDIEKMIRGKDKIKEILKGVIK